MESSSSAAGPRDAPVYGPIISIAALLIGNATVAFANENSPLWRLFRGRTRRRGGDARGPSLLFVSNRAAGAEGRRPRTYFALDVLDPEHLVTSFCLPTPFLLALHIFTAIYWCVYLAIDLAFIYGALSNPDPDVTGAYGEWMSFFTNWSITLLAVAGLFGLANTTRRFMRERRAKQLHSQFLAAAAAAPPPLRPLSGGGVWRKGMAGKTTAAEGVDGSSGDGVGVRQGAGEEVGRQQRREVAGERDQQATEGQAGSSKKSGPEGAPGGSSAQAEAAARMELGTWDTHPLTRPREKWDWLSISHLLVMETATSAAFFVTLWYWVGIFAVANKGGITEDASSFLAHAGNVGVALLQITLVRLPFASYHFQLLLWWGSLYLIFLWIYGAATGTWRYGLDIQKGRAAAANVLLPVICFITWLAWYGVACLREEGLCAAQRALPAARGGTSLPPRSAAATGSGARAAAGDDAPRRRGGLEMARADTLEHAASRLPELAGPGSIPGSDALPRTKRGPEMA